MSNTSIYNLFMPSKGYIGDFGLLCGFTATQDVLDRIKRSFSGDVSRPVLAAFIHPTTNAISDIPGLSWMWMHLDQRRDYNLLHAKVALLGFRQANGDGYLIRLAVSTGNWTSDPLTSSIDLFWHVDLETTSENLDPNTCADILAAWNYFNWLRKRADCALIEQKFDGHRADACLHDAITKLPETDVLPRFIDNREKSLFTQVVDRFSSSGTHNRLIIGSGYFEEDNENDSVPERLYSSLISNQSLQAGSQCDLFLNPGSCQGFHKRGTKLDRSIWKLRKAKALFEGQTKLHAKFVMLASDDLNAPGLVTGQLYLGSGNLSRLGFDRPATGRGNIEAGVVFDLPGGLRWDARGSNSIQKRLPVSFGSEIKPDSLYEGGKFETPGEPNQMPPVPYLIWEDQQIKAPDNQLVNIRKGENICSTPCDWPTLPPRIVEIIKNQQIWRIPVIAEGVLVVPRPANFRIEDILARLGSFPEIPELGEEDEVDAEILTTGILGTTGVENTTPATYAIRRMMELLVRVVEAQQNLDSRDWQRWCRELYDNFIAIYEQEKTMIDFFCKAEANPLTILLDPRIRPEGVQLELLERALEKIAGHWQLNKYTSLWGETA